MSRLWYQTPAADWYAALPIGNGRIGAMVFGASLNETIQLNEESIWSARYLDRNNPEAPHYRPKVRQLIAQGASQEAERLAQYALLGTPAFEPAYQTAGAMQLVMQDQAAPVTDYSRELDLNTAIAKVAYTQSQTHYRRQSFVSAPDQVLITQLSADTPNLAFSVTVNRDKVVSGIDYAGPDGAADILMQGGSGTRFAVLVHVRVPSGTVKRIGQYLIVEGAQSAEVFTAIATDYQGADPVRTARQQLQAALQHDAAQLRARHVADYQHYFKRLQLTLTTATSRLPTDQQLAHYRKDPHNLALIQTYFDYGRYLLLSASREDTLPANLQGVWNQELIPAWGSKYTININTEMNYWPAESTNLSETHLALFHLMTKMYRNGVKTAQVMYQVGGWVAHHNTDLWGDTAPQGIYMPASVWCLGAAWLCTHIWQHYQYTQDQAFLEQYGYLTREAVRFFVEYLTPNERGELVIDPSESPENAYIDPHSGQPAHLVAGCTMDAQILRDLFSGYLQMAERLQDDPQLVKQAQVVLQRLPQTQIQANGTIMEWPEAYAEPEPGHRHISHLYGLYPSDQISPFTTPQLAEAARQTIARRLAHGGAQTGWSRAWVTNMYARLLDGEAAYANLQHQLTDASFDNLLDSHPQKGAHAVFQIDGNLGATAAIMEMLVQCVAQRIVLLPALPKAWAEGELTGARLKGNLGLAMRWQAGQVVAATISCQVPHTVQLVINGRTQTVHLHAGRNQVAGPKLANNQGD